MDVNIQGLILKSLLNSPEDGLEIWPKLKAVYFDSTYSKIYSKIYKYYDTYNKLPSFLDFSISLRDIQDKSTVLALSKLEIPEEVDLDLAVDALIDEYTQREALQKIDKLLDHITIQSSDEIKQEINEIALYLEEKTHDPEQVFYMSDLLLLDKEELGSRVSLGLNNTFDADTGGMALTELLMIGGRRGSGKSVVATNINANQYLNGNVGLMFSIEMRARECFNRHMSMLADVPYSAIRKGKLSKDELYKIAEVRSDMFVDGPELFKTYDSFKSYEDYELKLIRTNKLKSDNQIIIVDNQNLTLADIDMNISKFKSMFGDKLKVVIVDYVNQIAIDNMYDWKVQIYLSKVLKNLARKHNIVLVTPYQIDASGEARFSKGLLDAADISMILSNPEEDYLELASTKVRNMGSFGFNVPINWPTLRISSTDYIKVEQHTQEDDIPI